MDRAMLKELGFRSRNEALEFLKKLWRQEKAECPICGSELELLHKKANDRIAGLKPTMLKGDERAKWNEGSIENIALVPKAYVGDPAGYRYIRADMDKVYEAFAKSLYSELNKI